MKIGKHLLITSTLLFAGSLCSAAELTADEAWEKGKKLFLEENNTNEAWKALESAASKGHLKAQLFLGNFALENGDLKEAFKWFELAAKQNDPIGQYRVAEAYAVGIKDFIQQDMKKAFEMLSKSAAQKYPPAQYYLTRLYVNGWGTPVDNKKAAELLQLAASQGYLPAQTELAQCYLEGFLFPKDVKKAIEWLTKAAASGYPEAQYRLGCCYYSWIGTQKNLAEAAKWWQKAAEQNHIQSANEIGLCYFHGFGVKPDIKTAKKWFEKAAAGKHAYALFALGRISATADKDYTKAARFFQQAVDNGSKDALYELANCYFHGFGVKPDKAKGLELLHKAAEQGVPDAQHILGTLYEKGDGVPKDAKKAVEWFSRAVENGYLPAFCPLAAAYFNGNGVAKDLKMSADLLRYAIWMGDADAKTKLDDLKITFAPSNIKFTYTPEIRGADGKDTAPQINFSKAGKVLLSIGAKVQNLCFVEEVWADKDNNKMRLTFTPYNFEGKNFDWRTKLLDLKGDGDFCYLIIADYHTGSSPEDMKGYVIDVKDNFKHIATIPVGEAFDLPYHNPKLIFDGEK